MFSKLVRDLLVTVLLLASLQVVFTIELEQTGSKGDATLTSGLFRPKDKPVEDKAFIEVDHRGKVSSKVDDNDDDEELQEEPESGQESADTESSYIENEKKDDKKRPRYPRRRRGVVRRGIAGAARTVRSAGAAAGIVKPVSTTTKEPKYGTSTRRRILEPFQGGFGAKGDTGEKGAVGDVGPKGHKGAVGKTGQTGPKGKQGIAGKPGEKGKTGPTEKPLPMPTGFVKTPMVLGLLVFNMIGAGLTYHVLNKKIEEKYGLGKKEAAPAPATDPADEWGAPAGEGDWGGGNDGWDTGAEAAPADADQSKK
eukprot:TRINITY_DN81295_c0_g1_i1.p1 TRINITY_DN81295_c0_g1~~TRINITY_DN81295_c0_g1_i1.p1  ORF type:complete len:310 (+),score=67.96 TRINITY_DN81295_c0_g1_i1:89-1018(+)